MNKKQKLLLGTLVLLLVGFLGCAAFQDAVTPNYIPSECIEYSGANVPRWPGLYTTINDAKYVLARMNYLRELNDVEFRFITNDLTTNISRAEELRDAAFDPNGALGLLIPTISAFGLGSLLVSKPGDRKEIEKLKNGKTNVS